MGAIISGPIGNSRGGGAGYHVPNEECNGMLRIWDGPLREVPVCNDLNWYACFDLTIWLQIDKWRKSFRCSNLMF